MLLRKRKERTSNHEKKERLGVVRREENRRGEHQREKSRALGEHVTAFDRDPAMEPTKRSTAIDDETPQGPQRMRGC